MSKRPKITIKIVKIDKYSAKAVQIKLNILCRNEQAPDAKENINYSYISQVVNSEKRS